MEPCFFAHFNEYLVTANPDGSIPLKARVVARLAEVGDGILLTSLIEQANETARRFHAAKGRK